MQQQNWVQLVFILIVLGFSLLSWIFRKLAEARKRHMEQVRQEQRQIEVLRTGRDAQSPEAPAGPSLEEIAAERQRQLQELRRRQQEMARGGSQQRGGGQGGGQGGPPEPIILIPGSSGPIIVGPGGARTGQPGQRRGSASPTTDRRRAQAERRRAEMKAASGPRPEARPMPAPMPKAADVMRKATPSGGPGLPVGPAMAGLKPSQPVLLQTMFNGRVTREDLRKAVILREVLAPPLGIR